MTMQIINTVITEGKTGGFAEITIADSAVLEESKQWIRLRVQTPIDVGWSLAAIQRSALQKLREVIAAEILRTGNIASQRDN